MKSKIRNRENASAGFGMGKRVLAAAITTALLAPPMSITAFAKEAPNTNATGNAESGYLAKTKLAKAPTTLKKAKKQLKAAKKAMQKAKAAAKKAKANASAAEQRVVDAQNAYDAAVATASAADDAAKAAFNAAVDDALKEREDAASVYQQRQEELSAARQAEEGAQSAVEQAQKTYDRAKSSYDSFGVGPDLAKLKAGLDGAQSAVSAAQVDVDAKQGEYDLRTQQLKQAQDTLATEKKAYDDAEAERAKRSNDRDKAQQDYDAKSKARKDADAAYKAAQAAEASSKDKLAAAEEEVKKAQDGLASKRADLDAANKKLKDLQAQKAQGVPQNEGAYDFFVSLGDQEAADVLNNAKYASETNLGVENDASHIDNVRCIFQFLKECNAIRESLSLDELKVTSTMMAYAISNCNWSDTNKTHSEQFNVAENLAWGYGKEAYQLGGNQSAATKTNPFYGWYDEEKKIWDAKKGGCPGIEDMTLAAMRATYPDFYSEVAHYLNIICSDYKITGFAYNTVNDTFCQVFYCDASSGENVYTVDDYEAKYEAWYATLIDPNLDNKIEAAQAEVDQAQSAYYKASNAVSKAEDARKASQAEYDAACAETTKAHDASEAAQQEEEASLGVLSSAQNAYSHADAWCAEKRRYYDGAVSAEQQAAKNQTAAQDELTKAQDILTKAKTDESGAQRAYDAALSWYDSYAAAADAYTAARTSLKDAQTQLDEAAVATSAMQQKADEAKNILDATADKLQRAEALTYNGPDIDEVTDADFAHLNDFIKQVRQAYSQVSVTHESYKIAQKNAAAKQTRYQQKQEAYASCLTDMAFAQANYDKLKAKSKKSKK